MKLIRNLFKKLTDNKQPKVKPVIQPYDNYQAQWETERENRIVLAEKNLKDWVIAFLKDGGKLSYSWESGGDEAFIRFAEQTDIDEENFLYLGEYILIKLNIPDAGEFQMNGSGTIYLDDKSVKTAYSSTMKALIDFDEETGKEIYEDGAQDSGSEILFTV